MHCFKTSLLMLLVVLPVWMYTAVALDEDGEYEEDSLDVVNFSPAAHSEFQICLAEGKSLKCIAEIEMGDLDFEINVIQKVGNFSQAENVCKYYVCMFSILVDQIICEQTFHQTACETKFKHRFVQMSEVCCEPACVGLFWANSTEIFQFDNESELGECDTGCQCTAYEATTIQTEKVDSSTIENVSTLNDSKSVDKPESSPSATSTVTRTNISEVAVSPIINLTSLEPYTTGVGGGASAYKNLSDRSTNTTADKNESNTMTIGIAVGVVAITGVAVVVVLVYIVLRRRHRGCNSGNRQDSRTDNLEEGIPLNRMQNNGAQPVGGDTTSFIQIQPQQLAT